LEVIHSDLKGPYRVKTREGHFYRVTFLDDFTAFKVTLRLMLRTTSTRKSRLCRRMRVESMCLMSLGGFWLSMAL
jgi:hypothetical protein